MSYSGKRTLGKKKLTQLKLKTGLLMNRRKSLIVAMLCVTNGVMAQSVEDGLKDLYYGKYETAKQNLEKAIAAKPTDDRAYYYAGIAQLGLHDDAGAAATFQKGFRLYLLHHYCR
jgi:tetratricopeptide (TPR) repeat protein